MNAVVFEHVPLADLPAAWREKLRLVNTTQVTVSIQEEPSSFQTDDPAFGIWSDREELQDVEAYARSLRQPRYLRNGSRSQP